MHSKIFQRHIRLAQLRRLLQGNQGATSVEYALVLCVTLGIAFVVAEAFALTPLHHKLITAMSPEEVAAKLHLDTAPIDESVLHDYQVLDDRAFFWKAIAGGLALLLVIKAIWFFCELRKRKATSALGMHCSDEAVLKMLFEKRQRIYHAISQHLGYLFNDRLEVRQIMSTQLVAVEAEMPTKKVTELMEDQRLRHVIVVDKAGKLVGVISSDDVYAKSPNDRLAKDIMTAHPVTVGQHDRLTPVITLLLERRVGTLPVLHEGKLVGIITRTDLLLLLQGILQTLAQPDIHERLQEECVVLSP